MGIRDQNCPIIILRPIRSHCKLGVEEGPLTNAHYIQMVYYGAEDPFKNLQQGAGVYLRG